jgi:hypothetical protein
MTPVQWAQWFQLTFGPVAVMNPMFAFWVNMAIVTVAPPPAPTKPKKQ